MIVVVLDANVLVSGLLSRKGPPGQILAAWRAGRFRLVVSPPILDEVDRALHYPRILERTSDEEIEQLVNDLSVVADWTPGKLTLNVLTKDPTDNMYLACAVEADAGYVVTGNIEHFAEVGSEYQGIRILTPRQFLGVLEMEAGAEGGEKD